MPKLKNRCPKNCRDRSQAFSWYNGKRIYHGAWGSPEVEENYRRFRIALLESPVMLLQDGKTGDVIVSELAAAFIRYAESRNMDKTDVGHFKTIIGYLVEIYGELSVNEFSPKRLKVVRNQMVKAGTLSRRRMAERRLSSGTRPIMPVSVSWVRTSGNRLRTVGFFCGRGGGVGAMAGGCTRTILPQFGHAKILPTNFSSLTTSFASQVEQEKVNINYSSPTTPPLYNSQSNRIVPANEIRTWNNRAHKSLVGFYTETFR